MSDINENTTNDILVLDNIRKEYTRGFFKKEVTFSIEASFRFSQPEIICLTGTNGAGKTTLFEIMTGGNRPTKGTVYCYGQNIHNVKYKERDRLAIHYHQSYQVRKIKWTKPNFLMDSAKLDYPIVHLFDEPQFNPQDGYIGFMIDFFQYLKKNGKLVFVCLHPMENYHLEILHEISDEFMFVYEGKIYHYNSWEEYTSDENVRQYLGLNLEKYEKSKDE